MIISEKKRALLSSDAVATILRETLAAEDPASQVREHFWVIGLNVKNVSQYFEEEKICQD